MANINNTDKRDSLGYKGMFFAVSAVVGFVAESLHSDGVPDSNIDNLVDSFLAGYVGVPLGGLIVGKTWKESTKYDSPYATAGYMVGQTLAKYLR